MADMYGCFVRDEIFVRLSTRPTLTCPRPLRRFLQEVYIKGRELAELVDDYGSMQGARDSPLQRSHRSDKI